MLEKFSFNSLINEVGHIRIPKIQRDYAQGRRNRRVDEIRQVFIHSLLQVVNGNVDGTELDFVYGSIKNDAFEPLDGQQRLTTLFLLHWMLGCDTLKDEHEKSVFTYETRNTSKDFCNELVNHQAQQFVDEAKARTVESEATDNPVVYRVSDILTKRDWFNWSWKFDPTIQSMLVMMDAIYDEMDWSLNLGECRERLTNITFNRLNLGDFGLSNELFVKMNARGKELSDFDKMKSTLEEEIQQQKNEGLLDEATEGLWRKMIDSDWIDLFWSKYARSSNPTTIKDAQRAEHQLKKLLLRLIALQLFAKHPQDESLYDAAYKIDEQNLDSLIFIYQNSLLNERSNNQCNAIRIKFKDLIADVNALIFKDGNEFKDVTSLLSRQSHLEDNDNTLLDDFLDTRVGNDKELVFYASLLFLREFPAPKDKDHKLTNHTNWLINFEEWVKLMRNVIMNDNLNQRIDKPQFVAEAIKNIQDFISAFNATSPLVNADPCAVCNFVSKMEIRGKYNRLDNPSLEEEKAKATLKLNDPNWQKSIDEAEKHHFLWGQIRCLIGWSGEDIAKFDEYRNKLVKILDNITNEYYAALLAVCGDEWKNNNRLYEFNKNRYYGIKRHLRDSGDGEYAKLIKILIDTWINKYSSLSEASEFYKCVIDDSLKSQSIEPWKICVLRRPDIMDESWRKCIFEDNGHVVLAQQKTIYSHCFDPILLYLHYLCGEKKIKNTLGDSKDEKPYSLVFTINYGVGKTTYHVQWDSSKQNYNCLVSDSELPVPLSPEKLLEASEKRIKRHKND